METLITVAVTIVGLMILFIFYLNVSAWVDEREEQRFYQKRKESFEYVAQNIKGCTHWLNGEHRKPFREFFDFMVKEMEERNGINSEALRIEADRISSTLCP